MPSPRTARAGLLSAALLAGAALAGCSREPIVDLADYARHQRQNVTTRWVTADGALAARLLEEGWRVDSNEGAQPALRMVHPQARVWFFSSDGTTMAAELHRSAPAPEPAVEPVVSFRVNDHLHGAVRWRSDLESLTLPFADGVTRIGWNALDLFLGPKRPEGEGEALSLRGIRFRDRLEGRVATGSPRELTVEDGELRMPAGSFLDAAFEVPAKAELRLRATSDSAPAESSSLRVDLELLDGAGERHDLGGFKLEPGDTERLSIDLDRWSGQTVSLRMTVHGRPSSFARFSRAEIAGSGERQPAQPPIRPSRPPSTARLGRPNVLLIVLDAARADAFGAYGSSHPTPGVDSLAAAGTLFARAQAPSSWTGQSIPSLLTGLYPDTLRTERWGDPLPAGVPSVAELLQRAGYRTVLWSQHPIYKRTPSLARGFGEVHYSGRRKRSRLPPRAVLFERDRPTFALIHLLPPHSPYAPPAPFRGAYTSGYAGKVPAKLGAVGEFGRTRLLELTARDVTYIHNRYLENVAFADSLVQRLLSGLVATGRFEETLVVVTADHGEAFFEHGLFTHSRELYQEFVHVPMVVKWPGGLEEFSPRVEAPVSLVDLVPTLVDGLGLEAGGGFQGVSLLPAAFDGAPLERPIYATTRGSGHVTRLARPRWMLEQGDRRVIHDPVAARTELYAVTADPEETNDLAPAEPTVARLLLQRLLMQRAFNLDLLQLGPRAETELDPELLRELKALGYL